MVVSHCLYLHLPKACFLIVQLVFVWLQVEHRFKIKNTGSRIPTPRQRGDAKAGTSKKPGLLDPNTLEGANSIASHRVADADNKSFAAAEAVKESEDIKELTEESWLILEVAKGIWERCNL